MRKLLATTTIVGALALAGFPAGAAATAGHGNSDQQNAPTCERGQITALIHTGDGEHFGKALACFFNVPPRS